MIKVVSGENCPGCKQLVRALKKEKVDFGLYDRDSKEGKAILKKYGISHIPFTVISKGGITKLFEGSSITKILDLVQNMG